MVERSVLSTFNTEPDGLSVTRPFSLLPSPRLQYIHKLYINLYSDFLRLNGSSAELETQVIGLAEARLHRGTS